MSTNEHLLEAVEVFEPGQQRLFRQARLTGEQPHADLGMLSGRDAATKLRVTDALVQAIAPLVQPGPQVVQVTSEARDMDRDCYSKRLIPGA